MRRQLLLLFFDGTERRLLVQGVPCVATKSIGVYRKPLMDMLDSPKPHANLSLCQK